MLVAQFDYAESEPLFNQATLLLAVAWMLLEGTPGATSIGRVHRQLHRNIREIIQHSARYPRECCGLLPHPRRRADQWIQFCRKLPAMDPRPEALDSILPSGGTVQYRIPAYQRRYAWDREQLHGLWRDVGALLSASPAQNHFCGVLLKLDRPGEGVISNYREVIDGQQRLITLLILLTALRDHEATVEGRSIAFDEDPLVHLVRPGDLVALPDQIIKCHDPHEDRRLYKVLHGEWRAMLSGDIDDPIVDAYAYFRYCFWLGLQSFAEPESVVIPKPRNWSSEGEPEATWLSDFGDARNPIDCVRLKQRIRKQISLLPLTVSEADEDPILIFDAINGRRLEFSQWDHAKTLLFRRLGDVHRLYEQWTATENGFKDAIRLKGRRRQSLETVAEGFLYDFVISRSGPRDERPKVKRAAIQLRKLLQKDGRDPTPEFTEGFIGDEFLRAAKLYCSCIAPVTRPKDAYGRLLTPNALESIDQIESFSANTARPLVLSVLEWWHADRISEELLSQALRSIEAHHCRLFLMGEDFSPLRARMMQLMAQVNSHERADPEDRARHMIVLLSRADLADGKILARHASPRALCDDVNKSRVQVAALLRGIEAHLSGGAGHPLPHGQGTRKFEVEHIFPQSCIKELNPSWQDDLRRWRKRPTIESYRERVNVLGNLALILGKANKKSAAKGFGKKQDVLRKNNPALRHLEDVIQSERWLPENIDERNHRLLAAALKHWPLSPS
jgi:hypothetical protein